MSHENIWEPRFLRWCNWKVRSSWVVRREYTEALYRFANLPGRPPSLIAHTWNTPYFYLAAMKGTEMELRYSSTLSLTSVLDWVGGQRRALAALHPGMTRYQLCRSLCGPQSLSGQVRKISPFSGIDPRTVQAVASRYTDYAHLATM